ncbi:MAG: NFACT RNA binding domain-containing protein [Bacteroidota bacterium]
MLSNYFTLFHIAKELQLRYARTVIAEVYSQEKNTLSLLLYAPEPHTITICCNARENYIVARPGDSRTQKNSINLFPSLVDMHIESVYVSATDRVIYFKFSGEQWLCLEMFASKANVFLLNKDGIITDAFLNKKELLGTAHSFQAAEQQITSEMLLPAKETFLKELFRDETESKHPVQRLKKALPKLGTTLANEIMFTSNSGAESISAETAERIFNESETIIRRIVQMKRISPSVYFEERSPYCFSLLPLEHLSSFRVETYDDLFIGIQKFISFERSTSSYLQKKKEITAWLSKEREKAHRTINAVEAELAESSRAEQYELYAHLIMAHLPSIAKGMRSITVENSFTQTENVTIPLEPTLTPQKNSEKYHEKAKKSRSGRVEAADRLLQLKKRIQSIDLTLEKSKDITDSFSLKNFLHSYGGMVKELGFMTEKEQDELPPFKIFAVEGGFTVYAGKNSINNDLLTFRHAKPNDLWFHARGSSGSHVVLKVGSAQGTPSKKAVEQAAAIAAYYSKMKNAKHVPVAMTERKYIHKPKGAPAGTVALDKEKVIFVQPVLPENKT